MLNVVANNQHQSQVTIIKLTLLTWPLKETKEKANNISEHLYSPAQPDSLELL